MAEPWVGIVNRSVQNVDKELRDMTKVDFLVARMLQSRGRIKLGVDWGYEKTYPVDWREQEPEEFGYGSDTHYEPFDPIKKATMTPRGMQVSDAMHQFEKETMDGAQGELVRRYARIVPKNMKAMQEAVWRSFFLNGTTAANRKRFSGIPTVMGTPANTGAGEIIGMPNTTYHGISTALAQGGRWSSDLPDYPNETLGTDYPEGEGSRDYHYWSPLNVNWSSNAWGTSQTGWADNATRVISRTAMWLRHTHNATGQLVCLMSTNLMSEWNQYWLAKNQNLPPHDEGTRYGFHDTMNYEGVLIQAGYGIPANTAYMFEIDAVKLLMVTKKLVETQDVKFDEDTNYYKWRCWNIGEYKFSPKHCAEIKNYA